MGHFFFSTGFQFDTPHISAEIIGHNSTSNCTEKFVKKIVGFMSWYSFEQILHDWGRFGFGAFKGPGHSLLRLEDLFQISKTQ